MEFFKKIAQLGTANIEIKIVEKNGTLSVSFITKSMAKDNALGLIKPIVVSGIPEELDAEFFNVISKPVEKAVGVISNIESFEKSVEEAEKKNAEAKEKAKNKKSDASKSKTTDNKKVESSKKDTEEKPKPPSPHQKYIDAVLNIVSVEGFKLKKANRNEVKTVVDMLWAVDKTNPLVKEWEDKIKEFDEEAASLFYEEDNDDVPAPAPEKPVNSEPEIIQAIEDAPEEVVKEEIQDAEIVEENEEESADDDAVSAPPPPSLDDDDDDDDLPYTKED